LAPDDAKSFPQHIHPLIIVATTTALKLKLLRGCQTPHGTILDGDHIAASAWNTGFSFRYGLVLVRATKKKSGIGPCCRVVHEVIRIAAPQP
jgi:hypothetical protein